jgi:hypothetical protein
VMLCEMCGTCIHNRNKDYCKHCGTTRCIHGRGKYKCWECVQCIHGTNKNQCGICTAKYCHHGIESNDNCVQCEILSELGGLI